MRGKKLHRGVGLVGASSSRPGPSAFASLVVGGVIVVVCGSRGMARAQVAPAADGSGAPVDAIAQAPAGPSDVPPRRPRLSASVGAGGSYDTHRLSVSRASALPAFAATAGFGEDWPVGAELGAVSTSVSGSSAGGNQSITRLGLDAYSVIHPLVLTMTRDDRATSVRLLRAFGVEVGLGLERDSLETRSGSRWGLHTGLRVEVPVSLVDGAGDLRVRLVARRLFGLYTPTLGTTPVRDTVETLVAVVSVF